MANLRMVGEKQRVVRPDDTRSPEAMNSGNRKPDRNDTLMQRDNQGR